MLNVCDKLPNTTVNESLSSEEHTVGGDVLGVTWWGMGVEILICECTELNVELLGVLG